MQCCILHFAHASTNFSTRRWRRRPPLAFFRLSGSFQYGIQRNVVTKDTRYCMWSMLVLTCRPPLAAPWRR